MYTNFIINFYSINQHPVKTMQFVSERNLKSSLRIRPQRWSERILGQFDLPSFVQERRVRCVRRERLVRGRRPLGGPETHFARGWGVQDGQGVPSCSEGLLWWVVISWWFTLIGISLSFNDVYWWWWWCKQWRWIVWFVIPLAFYGP